MEAAPSEADVVSRLGLILSPEGTKETATKVSDDTLRGDSENESPDPEEAPEGEESDDGAIETLDQVAQRFGVDAEKFTSEISLTEADGTKIPLSEVIRNYRESKANGKLFDDVAGMRTELENRERSRYDEHAREFGQLQKLTADLLQQVKQADEIDWKSLEDDDPTRFVLERQKHLERLHAADNAVRRIEQEREREASTNAARREGWIREERGKLLEKNPEWQQPEKFAAAVGEVATYLTDNGYDPKDPGLNDLVMDHRNLRTLWKAAQWDALNKKGALSGKKLETLPRVIRASARGDETAPRDRKLATLRERQHKLGDKDSTIALLKERMRGTF